MNPRDVRQATLPVSLQAAVVDLALRQYPEFARVEEIPLIIALPAGIHPYNKSSGYYVNKSNTIVLYQQLGRAALSDKLNLMTVAHELAHWYQLRFLGEKGEGTTNMHRRSSWMDACYEATCNLWPELKLARWQFNPTKSIREKGFGIRKIQREGAMTDVQLHHWPRSLTEFSGKKVTL